MKKVTGRTRPAFRSPEKVVEDIANIQGYLRAPTFVVGDIRQNGQDYEERFFKALKERDVDNPRRAGDLRPGTERVL